MHFIHRWLETSRETVGTPSGLLTYIDRRCKKCGTMKGKYM